MSLDSANLSVGIVGGGLAGLAAAAALAGRGLRVELFETHKVLGGRAGSFRDPHSGVLVDFCQHVAMECCTNLLDFCRTTRVDDCFRRHRELHFFGPTGEQCDFRAAGWLPAPLHLFPALMRLRYLTLGERLGIIRAMRRLARAGGDDGTTIGAWLRRNRQSERMIERFWSVVLVSALSETVDRSSMAAARKVFVDGFLASRRAYELLLPTLPLAEIFDRRVGAWLAQRDVVVHRRTKVAAIRGDACRAAGLVLADGSRRDFDFVVVAVPWQRIRSLFSEAMLAALPRLAGLDNFRAASITAVHLWFDRAFTPLPHAVLVGKLAQWLFNLGETTAGHYCQVVISASHALAGRDRRELVSAIRDELASLWPGLGKARLLRHRVVTNPAAVFSVRPGLEQFRPVQQTPLENLFLAGDWTATGWPATMEGAVRSGRLAAEGVLKVLGQDQ